LFVNNKNPAVQACRTYICFNKKCKTERIDLRLYRLRFFMMITNDEKIFLK